jgi:thioredoxin reductase (NADPH)
VVFIRYGPGYFTGDIDLLTRRPSVVSCEAETDVEAIRLTPSQLRDMFTRSPQFGEKFWKSFQGRRELLLCSKFRGLSIYGKKDDKATLDAVELLFRNSVPHEWLDTSLEANRLKLRQICENVRAYPVVAHGSRVLFEAPSRAQLANHLRLRRDLPKSIYDVVILGRGAGGTWSRRLRGLGGPGVARAGRTGPGGQAGSTSRIENYAGFPDGIAGRDLAHLAYLQALKFGADFHVPSTVSSLERRDDGLFRAKTTEGDCVLGKTVIVAAGVSYGVLNVEGLKTLHGAGVHYSATNVESRLCRGCPTHVVGAGNSAGQAAMFLSQTATEVSLLVRGLDLRKMSSYLAERLLANKRVRIRYRSEVVAVDGDDHISGVRVRGPSGEISEESTSGLFVFIGTKPRTGFLPPSIVRDDKGFLQPVRRWLFFRVGKRTGRRAPPRPAFPACLRRATAEGAPPSGSPSRLETARRLLRPSTIFSSVRATSQWRASGKLDWDTSLLPRRKAPARGILGCLSSGAQAGGRACSAELAERQRIHMQTGGAIGRARLCRLRCRPTWSRCLPQAAAVTPGGRGAVPKRSFVVSPAAPRGSQGISTSARV